MNRTPETPLEQRFQALGLNILFTVTLSYIAMILLSTMMEQPQHFPLDLFTLKYGMLVVSVGAAFAGLIAPRRLKWIVGIMGVLAGALLVVTIRSGEASVANPAVIHIWAVQFIMLMYAVFGTRIGAAVTVFLLVMPPLAMWGVAGVDAALRQTWVVTSVAVCAVAMIAHHYTAFLLRSMTLYAEDHAKLRAARQDGVTDVYGRAAIEEELERAMTHAAKDNTPVSIVVVDIDHFKGVNDRHGHATGDDVLRAVAKRLRRNVGGMGGMVGRWGGEEFLVLLPGIAKPDALVLAERLRHEIAGAPLAGLNVTASFGVASYRGKGDTTDELFGRADMAMYEAKRSGRNAVR
ncbi:GGDEF domain-containing protein [Deinococcus taklimakanensis]|uniref:GGDEF domain-containing protein n=1 Tax=Deinococcus taklimakanensis TaxID=536443 RepID=A0ABW5P9A0_9DEIO